ncbi:MAG: PorT family protein [Bacteroidales bacterium]|nr:PorT family protein [Bacteroidales bacterium]
MLNQSRKSVDNHARIIGKASLLRRLILVIGCCLASVVDTSAQVTNLAGFDDHMLHYGIQIGYTGAKFDVGFTQMDSIRGRLNNTNSYNQAGFHIAVIGDMRIGRFFSLRALPGVSLLSREITYTWDPAYQADHPIVDPKRTVESVYGDFPIEIKYKAMRWNNFRPYVTGGASYGFDFASLRKNKNNNDEAIIRLNPNDIRYSLGVGSDFFLSYVKFAIELKMNFGVLNLRVDDNDIYTLSTDKLTSRTYMICFTFEG